MKMSAGDVCRLTAGVFAVSTTIHSRSPDHGPPHWGRVAIVGAALTQLHKSAVDPTVVQLFSLFHDSMRFSEYEDEDHGRRGMQLAEHLHVPGLVSMEQWRLFAEACVEHDRGALTTNPTIGVCWDADRLDLGRVGITPDASYLSTDVGKFWLDEGKTWEQGGGDYGPRPA